MPTCAALQEVTIIINPPNSVENAPIVPFRAEFGREILDDPSGLAVVDLLHRWSQMRNLRFIGLRAFGWATWALWMTARATSSPIGRRRPIATAAALWTWQLWRRIVRLPVVVTLPEGSKLICPPWSRLGGAYVSEGFHEPSIAMFLLDFLRGDSLFVDVGSNIGFYSMIAARRGSRVLAFEPTESCCDTIAASAELNGLAALVRVYCMALSNVAGTALFTTSRDNTNMLVSADAEISAEERSNAIEIDVRTLDEMLAAKGPVTAIKIDAEGADLQVLAGSISTIAVDRPALVVEVYDGGSDVRSWLHAQGYEVYRYVPSSRELRPAPPVEGSDNLIAIHRDEMAVTVARLRETFPHPLRMPRAAWRRNIG